MKIEFNNLGRGKLTFIIPYNGAANNPDGIAEAAQREARKHTVSRFIDALYDMDKNEGQIVAGYRPIGTFKLIA